MKFKLLNGNNSSGFTLPEVAMVIVVIAMLGGLAALGYRGWQERTVTTAVKSDLTGFRSALESERNFLNSYPLTMPTSFKPSEEVTLSYNSVDGSTFCAVGTSQRITSVQYTIRNTGDIETGANC